jgi:hypothetical protein
MSQHLEKVVRLLRLIGCVYDVLLTGHAAAPGIETAPHKIFERDNPHALQMSKLTLSDRPFLNQKIFNEDKDHAAWFAEEVACFGSKMLQRNSIAAIHSLDERAEVARTKLLKPQNSKTRISP